MTNSEEPGGFTMLLPDNGLARGKYRYRAAIARRFGWPVTIAAAIGVVRLLVAEWRPLEFLVITVLAWSAAVAVVWSGRRRAKQALGITPGEAPELWVVLLSPRSGLWSHAGGTGFGGWIQEWLVVVSDGEVWAARGDLVVALALESSQNEEAFLRSPRRLWKIPARRIRVSGVGRRRFGGR